MTESKVGVTEIKNLVSFVIAMVHGSVASLKDGKLSFMDIFNFFGAIMAAGPALRHLNELKGEIMDLDQAEKDMLCKHVRDTLTLEDKVVEDYVEKALCLIVSCLDFLPLTDSSAPAAK